MRTTEPTAPFDLAESGHTGTEILGQPGLWVETVRTVADRRPALDALTQWWTGASEARVILTGAGSSAFVGRVAAPLLARITGRRFDAVPTTDLVAQPSAVLAEDVPTLVVSFARSGNSPESVAATDVADRLLTHVRHLVVTCDAGGALADHHAGRAGSVVLTLPAGCNDKGFAMTASYTSMLLAGLQAFLGDEGLPTEALQRAAEVVLADADGVLTRCAATAYDRVVYLGSGSLAGAAQESALKLLELTAGRVNTYHDSPLGFRHGPKSVVDAATLVVVLLSEEDYTRQYDLDLLAELATDGVGDLVALSARPLPTGLEVPTVVLPSLAGLDGGFLAVPYVVFAQALAVATSLRLGITPDNPSPSGMVNRVVQGVTIHPLA